MARLNKMLDLEPERFRLDEYKEVIETIVEHCLLDFQTVEEEMNEVIDFNYFGYLRT
jgi:hypothetical protein